MKKFVFASTPNVQIKITAIDAETAYRKLQTLISQDNVINWKIIRIVL